jgi:hypothetical protein
MFARRRPLLRTAVVGGGAYMIGKRSAQHSAQQEDNQQPEQGSTGAAPATQASDGGAPSISDQLAKLSSLHAQGSLSDAEFASAKSRLLGS